MLPGLDGISAAAILDRLSLLKYRNAHGSHIYIRPAGEHRFSTFMSARAAEVGTSATITKLLRQTKNELLIALSVRLSLPWSRPTKSVSKLTL
jgi:hypothetical protein